MFQRLPPCGGSGLKLHINVIRKPLPLSPSMRREWIEISTDLALLLLRRLPPCGGSGLKFWLYKPGQCNNSSPSMRREWIEILFLSNLCSHSWSPSMRREWIEIFCRLTAWGGQFCLPPCGGSGLKWIISNTSHRRRSLPPCGGSGLKLKTTKAGG